MKYLNWDQKTITDFSESNINDLYENGYVFTRIGKGIMQQTRSIRINLNAFDPTSENRRILKKTDGIILSKTVLPLNNYDYSLGKLAKDFYDNRFGTGIMSAQKIKEMLTDEKKSNFNFLLNYKTSAIDSTNQVLPEKNQPVIHSDRSVIGYAICFANSIILHYSYPFYDLNNSPKDMGLGMMIRAIMHAKETKLKYIYLGSLQRPSDTYKLQFNGLECFDGNLWISDIEKMKQILAI